MNLSALTLDALPLLDLDATNEVEVITRMTRQLAGNPAVIDPTGFLAAVLERQRINPPILGNGVAMPHARTPLVREIICVAARCAAPVPFGPEKIPVRLLFLFGIPPRRISEYLALTAALVKRLRSREVLEGLLTAVAADEFARLLDSGSP